LAFVAGFLHPAEISGLVYFLVSRLYGLPPFLFLNFGRDEEGAWRVEAREIKFLESNFSWMGKWGREVDMVDMVDMGWLMSRYGVRFLGYGERGFLVLRFVGFVGLVVVGGRHWFVCAGCVVPCFLHNSMG